MIVLVRIWKNCSNKSSTDKKRQQLSSARSVSFELAMDNMADCRKKSSKCQSKGQLRKGLVQRM